MRELLKPGTRREIVRLEDLAPQHDVKGGAAKRVFGADPLTARVPAETEPRILESQQNDGANRSKR
jgi:hypothetical protein